MRLILLFFVCLFMSPFSALASEIDIAGTWLVEDGSGKVEVADCGDGTPCGTLIWTDPAQGEPIDGNNPDPELRNRSLIGTDLFWGFKRKKTKWSSGKIYDARSGKTYKSKLQLKEDGTLRVKGCIGPICQGETWTRVDPE